MLDESFHCTEKANDLYSFVRLEDIEALNAQAALTRDVYKRQDVSSQSLQL